MSKERNRSIETVKIGIGLEQPGTGFAMMARSFGHNGDGPIEVPDQIGTALKKAVQVVKEERRMAVIDPVPQPR